MNLLKDIQQAKQYLSKFDGVELIGIEPQVDCNGKIVYNAEIKHADGRISWNSGTNVKSASRRALNSISGNYLFYPNFPILGYFRKYFSNFEYKKGKGKYRKTQ